MLTLYKVGTNGRIQLGADAAREGDFYTVSKDDETGVITLSPVAVQTTSARRGAEDGQAVFS